MCWQTPLRRHFTQIPRRDDDGFFTIDELDEDEDEMVGCVDELDESVAAREAPIEADDEIDIPFVFEFDDVNPIAIEVEELVDVPMLVDFENEFEFVKLIPNDFELVFEVAPEIVDELDGFIETEFEGKLDPLRLLLVLIEFEFDGLPEFEFVLLPEFEFDDETE